MIAHEAGHFLRRHQIRQWRDLKRKTAAMQLPRNGRRRRLGRPTGIYAGDLVRLAQFGGILSLFSYSRELEAEADAMGLKQIADAGYDPDRHARDLAAADRGDRGERRDAPQAPAARLFPARHPPAPETADGRPARLGEGGDDGAQHRARPRPLPRARSAPHRKILLDDQVKLNDPGASLYIVRNLAKDGWNGLLRYYEGEVWRLQAARGDSALAGQSYAAAIAYPDAPPEAWRAHGYQLLKDGRRDEGRAALNRYLALAPRAPDAAMVRHTSNQ